MKNFLMLLGFLSIGNLFGQSIYFEDTTSFFPRVAILEQDNIRWGNLHVPENWDTIHQQNENKTIKIAVSILQNLSDTKNAEAVVFIQGGPGAGSIETIGPWRDHPLRKEKDIILVDMRGTGFSSPRLCPDLGQEFLKILAKNQSEEEDENQKIQAVMKCQSDLRNKGVAIETYHSVSMAKDLNALKEQLGYAKWSVYAASYGTYVAQVYANQYPEDIQSLVLDSSIDDITRYYTQNTSNYINSLKKIFSICKNDKACNENYPNLEDVYYKTIADLKNNPITVAVNAGVLEGETFTYSKEDFKIALQQALYQKKMIEVIPLLIYQFQERNQDALGKLVEAFSHLLQMDYGVYYSVSCNEALPKNEISAYQNDVSTHKKLQGGVSFYKSDFAVCKQWNAKRMDSLTNTLSILDSLQVPVMILSGEFDPITPVGNGKALAKKLKSSFLVTLPNSGHVPGFTAEGRDIVSAFIDNPEKKPEISNFLNTSTLEFVKDITINAGVSNVGESLKQPDLIFVVPLGIALGIMLIAIFVKLFKLIRRTYASNNDILINTFVLITSLLGITTLVTLILALLKVASQNTYILAFGLPDTFSYVFTLLISFVIVLAITVILFIFRMKMIHNRSAVFSVLFSNILLLTYFLYWGVVL